MFRPQGPKMRWSPRTLLVCFLRREMWVKDSKSSLLPPAGADHSEQCWNLLGFEKLHGCCRLVTVLCTFQVKYKFLIPSATSFPGATSGSRWWLSCFWVTDHCIWMSPQLQWESARWRWQEGGWAASPPPHFWLLPPSDT